MLSLLPFGSGLIVCNKHNMHTCPIQHLTPLQFLGGLSNQSDQLAHWHLLSLGSHWFSCQSQQEFFMGIGLIGNYKSKLNTSWDAHLSVGVTYRLWIYISPPLYPYSGACPQPYTFSCQCVCVRARGPVWCCLWLHTMICLIAPGTDIWFSEIPWV